jgi:hypothetical protein
MEGSEEELRMRLVQAYTRAVHPDAIRHLHEALRLLDPEIPTALEQCPACSRVMLPERIADHDCTATP